MSLCKGRNVSNSKQFRFPFYDSHGNITKKYYQIPVYCKNNRLESFDLCGICKEKENELLNYFIEDDILKDKITKKAVVKLSKILHGKIGDPIPSWSHMEDSKYFKNMLIQGYKKEKTMVKKDSIDVNKVYAFLSNLSDIQEKKEKHEKLMKEFPSLSKTSALKYMIEYNKSKKKYYC